MFTITTERMSALSAHRYAHILDSTIVLFSTHAQLHAVCRTTGATANAASSSLSVPAINILICCPSTRAAS
jgi:hypothetical protein